MRAWWSKTVHGASVRQGKEAEKDYVVAVVEDATA
jgi:hypothetical protein